METSMVQNGVFILLRGDTPLYLFLCDEGHRRLRHFCVFRPATDVLWQLSSHQGDTLCPEAPCVPHTGTETIDWSCYWKGGAGASHHGFSTNLVKTRARTQVCLFNVLWLWRLIIYVTHFSTVSLPEEVQVTLSLERGCAWIDGNHDCSTSSRKGPSFNFPHV